ncbi:GRB2-associated-binding protein 2 isoform X1 [Bombus vosnesenskii]|uniref:GRB2-associated-binding protein 2 isoform X1 n=3 Tax=Pyrobombus TaxID=144703 RepID=A0A6J3KT55_9HYME|nr:GRB2-associated-binding protein 2 isoform X1 [Bombus impatiens]XP_033187649.1 GRB2-associated-binding protein 2 isoform X1 [Bombus vancouverensis nearcticus]XP_033312676.1 GRB2-associated-binding protein 2 isoform X1 [Bombus bifarius]XP_033356277.1 GRB2-associated-binding protein 2 isoform X1 [Bombus vosnesenskii]
MEVLKTSQEIVHEGWLIKSPPTKLWRARWRKRWFALRHSGELPGQYFLEYYTDRRCRKLKGRIDLDQCEQVDAGLRFENRKQKYQYMFNVKTPKRTYYLVAESEADMNKWVDAVCQVCGLKAYTQDEEQQCQMFQFETQESPPISPTSTISGPYIPISECISGRRLNDTSSLNSALGQGPEHYDAPRRLAPSPSRSPTTTDAESVFTDDEWTAPVPSVNWETFPSSGESKQPHSSSDAEIGSWSVRKRFGKLRIVDSIVPPSVEKLPAPPRPPKPPHMLPENPGHNYLNLDGATESSKPTTPATPAPSTPATAIVTDESYDFPRSHQPGAPESNTIDKHFYSNAAPSNVEDTRVFRYDFQEEEPSSPRSESSATATYSNLPSPLVRDNSTSVPTTVAPPPPVVYRELKPGRKTSDSTSVISNEASPGPTVSVLEMSSAEHSPAEPPSINRKLKPPLNKSPVEGPLQLASPPGRGRIRAAPSPTPPTHVHSNRHQSTSDEDNNAFDDKEEIYYYQDQNTFIPASNRRLVVLQYLDLDLEATENFTSSSLPPTQSPPNTTVYKTVDFLKTEAFNRTRQRVEEERKQCTDELA